MLRTPLLALVLSCLPFVANAQLPTLVADAVAISPDGSTLTATGNVEILSGEGKLRADELVYNRETDELTIVGSLTIVDETGFLAVGNSAELTGDLRDGLIRGVRFLLDERTQVAAAEMHRVEGRYLQLFKAVASSCNVCENQLIPLWSISAQRVIHDKVQQQLYFYHARFEIAGLPIFYFHRLRMPDPTLDRATGFLIPRLKTSTNLSTGIKIPYFITLGDHADLLLTPYFSSRTNTLEGRYRQELSFGSLVVNGAITDDDLIVRDLRRYLFAEGRFFLPQDFRLNLDLELVSDNSYLLTYDYSDVDRLSSMIDINRSRRDEYFSTSIAALKDLVDTDNPNNRLHQGTATYKRRIWPAILGGEFRLALDAEGSKSFRTPSSIDSADRSYRTGMKAEWLRRWTLDTGFVATARGQLAADRRRVRTPEVPTTSFSRFIPAAALELRWPHIKVAESHSIDILEPMIQFAWADPSARRFGDGHAEFDEGNLLFLSRFPEFDRHERDWRTVTGLGWTHLAQDGSEYSVTAGRLFHRGGEDDYLPGSGLSSSGSDWLFSTEIKRDRLSFSTRALIDENAKFSRLDTQASWKDGLTSASGRYIWAAAVSDAPSVNDRQGVSELILDVDHSIHRHWTLSAEGRYDRSAGSTTEAGFGLTYRNECVTFDISLTRRFSSSEAVSVPTSTALNIGGSIGGFGRSVGPERTCRIRGDGLRLEDRP